MIKRQEDKIALVPKHHTVDAYGGHSGTDSLISKLGSSWRGADCRHRPLYPPEKSLRYPLDYLVLKIEQNNTYAYSIIIQ
jgi:hypothetical protein